MVLLLHILIAISSIGVATFTYFKPSMGRIATSYGFIVATVASGTVLLVITPASLLHACISGVLYVTIVSLVTIATHVRVRQVAAQALEQ